MRSYAVAYIVTSLAFLGIDAIWLTITADRFYRPNLSKVLADRVSMAPAAIFYLLYVAGIVIFAITPAFKTGSWVTAAVYGGLFGLFAYATYDLSNQATLKEWPVFVTIVDLCWGTALTATVATIGFVVTERFVAR